MTRTLLLSLATFALFSLGIAARNGELVALCLPLLLYLFVGYLRIPPKMELEVRRHLSAERASPHQPVTVTLSVTNLGAALDELLVEDPLPVDLKLLDGSNRHMASLARGESHTWTYQVSGARGYYSLPSVRVEARDGLGLIARDARFEIPGQLLILPPVLRLKHIAIRPRRTRVFAGTIPARVGGAGVDFYGVRDYLPGDPPRRINWKVSARQIAGLYSNEFEQERVADVGILLDGRQRTNLFGGGHSIFDSSVLAAAALADTFLSQGNRVGLLVYGKYLHWTLPAYGKIQREKILHALAEARIGGSEIFASLRHLPARLFPVNSQIVVVSPLAGDDLQALVQLRARGYQVLVVSPNPVTYELAQLASTREVTQAARILAMERTLLIRQMRRAGIQALDWDVTQPFDQLVRQSLSRAPQTMRAFGRLGT